ncbi:MAG: DUF1491 family protein [Sphingomonas bacterium]|nr:DUF1491 family protein [Sphingomonas bacterium]
MSDRLPARLEATALMRQVQSAGGFATIIKRGDADSGALILLVAERGLPRALIERQMGDDFVYRWAITARLDGANPEKFRESTDKATRFDPDCWLIELDVADAERFIAETIALP